MPNTALASHVDNTAPVEAAPARRRRDAFEGIEYSEVVGVASAMRGEARVASSTQEVWAAHALASLADNCDGAREEDGVGFNKSDTNAGRYLGHYTAAGGMLDDVEWQGAIDLLQKYHGQVGRMPRPDALDEARVARVEAQEAMNADGFKDRLAVVLREAKRIQKARDEHQHRLANPDVVIEREGADREDGGVWVVQSPYVAAAVETWRALHREFGGGWSKSRGVRIVPYRGGRALHALLTAHHAGQYARGLKGSYVIGSTVPPVRVEDVPPVVDADEADHPVAAVVARAVTTVSEALAVLDDPTATDAEIESALALLR